MNPEDGDSLAPEFIKTVVFPLKLGEDVDDDIAKIKQQPPRVHRPFMVGRQDAFMFQSVPHLVIDSRKLPLRLAAAYHEIIGKAAYLASIKQNDVARLLIGGSLHCFMGYIYCFQ